MSPRNARLRPFVYPTLILYVVIALCACTDKTAPQDLAQIQQTPQSPPIKATITEVTNLAVAVNPVNGDRVLAAQGTLYVQTAGTLDAHPITQWFDDAWEPDIAADGKSVVYKGYLEGTFDLWELSLTAGSKPQQLTKGPYDDREPQYSSDGRRIIFSSDRSGSYDIWQLDLRANELKQLTQILEEAHSPTWSSDGSRFAYVVSDRSGSKIIVQTLKDSSSREEVYSSTSQISGLQWVPQQDRLSYRARDRDPAGNAYTTLRRIDLGSKSIDDLSPQGMDVFPFRANWLDDGTLVFAGDGKIQSSVKSDSPVRETVAVEFEINLELNRPSYTKKSRDFDSTDPKPVLGISYPVVSPDGKHIAFTALGDLWLWAPDSETLTQLTDDPAADQTPSWSKDGKNLVYISDADGHPRINILKLESMELSTLKLDHKELSFPSLSPNGRQLAYFTDVPGNPLLHVVGQLTVYDFDSGESKTLLQPMPPQTLNWSGDGSHILTTRLYPYSKRYREGLYLPVVVNIDSGESHFIKPVADRSVTHASFSADNRLVYVQDGVLNALQLDSAYQQTEAPEVLFADLADTPNISSTGDYVVFQSGARLMKFDVATGHAQDITPPLTWAIDQPTDTWILRAGRVFDGDSKSYLTQVDIVVKGNRIVDIRAVDLDSDLAVVDASDQVVIPGLFESHAHIGDHNHSEPQGRAWLAYGITSVRDPGSNPYLANERKEAWSSGRRIGPRTFITGHNMDGNRVFYAVVEGITSDEHLERALRRSEELDVDFIKTYVRMSDTHQRRVVDFAHALGIPVTSHELLPAAAYGVDHIEHFTGTSRRGYATKISELGRSYQDVLEVLTKSSMGIVPTMVVPGVVLTFDEQDDLYNTQQFNAFYGPEAKQNYQDFMGFFGPGSEGYVDAYGELLSNLVEQGALVGTGTDSPFTPFAAGLHAELRLYQREGLAPYQILNAATLQSARIAGVEHDLGSIAIGKLADMVVVDGDPLSRISDISNIRYTIKNGRIYSLEELLDPSISINEIEDNMRQPD